MSELPKQYNPSQHEPSIYKLWEESSAFSLDELKISDETSPFVITLPPPNITGALHMGHALQDTIMDILIRFHRMKGQPTTWIPGTDSAAIATNRIIIDQLREEGKTRHDIGREEFMKRVEQWYEATGSQIISQMKALGASCDWDRQRFTMDNEYIKAVNHAFIEYYNRGYIYRGNRIVNWDPKAQTTVSDLEIDRQTQRAKFYTFQYGPFEIGTARPETKFGDKYVVMHPDDKRYAEYNHGDTFEAQWINGPVTATIIKDEAVDPSFGTGVMTITPWHDATDFEIAERHNLDKEQIIDLDGKLLPIAGEFSGQPIAKALPKIVEKLTEKGLLVSVDENYQHNVALNDRGKGILEPQIMRQWFVDMSHLKNSAINAAENDDVRFVPPRWKKHFLTWMNNVHDWNISRQIWLGHRMPAYFKHAKQGIDIVFVRHGESVANAEAYAAGHMDVELTEAGREETEQLKNSLGEFDAVYSSDLKRATGTADILLGPNAEYETDKRLREIDLGDLEGKSYDEARPFRATGFPGGESYHQVRDRVAELLSEIIDQHDGQRVLIIGHAGIRLVLENLLNGRPMNNELMLERTPREIFQYRLEAVVSVSEQAPAGSDWEQDPDVLDTWFATALWSFAPLGWPEETKDLQQLHPTSVLVTARDILYLWVARMVFSSIELLQEVPFKDIFIHPTVLAKNGQRMSKSLGTGIDPMDLINKYGADATRFGLMYQMSFDSQAIKFDENDVKSARNFANKIWNIARFIESLPDQDNLTFADQWITERFNQVAAAVTTNLEEYRIGEATHALYDFVWNDFADWYVEILKVNGSTDVAKNILQRTLQLLHPFIPYITEVIWQQQYQGLAITSAWPEKIDQAIDNGKAATKMSQLQETVTTIRSARALLNIRPGSTVQVSLEQPIDEPTVLEALSRSQVVEKNSDMNKFPLPSGGSVYLGSDEITPASIQEALAKLAKEQQDLESFVVSQEKSLSSMRDKAPEQVVADKENTIAQAKSRLQELETSQKMLK